MENNDIMVSIVCNTYNHENYIRDALEGFVSQKTNFLFEVLVMDDASADGTADIIREYEKKYPEIIKPVYQTVNQWSRGLGPARQNRERAQGKYVAMCEGDDYWIDEYKLQKQFDYMETHPDCTFCFTNGYLCYGVSKYIEKKVVPWNKEARIKKDSDVYDVGEIERLGYIPTCSFMWRNGLEVLPVSEGAFQGDTYLKISMTSHGYAYFIDEPMVVYRQGNEQSTTGQWRQQTQSYIKYCDRFIQLFSDLGNLLQEYKDIMAMRACQWKISKYYALNDYAELNKIVKSGEIKNLKYDSWKSFLYYTAKCRYPILFKTVLKIGKRMKNILLFR